MTWKDAYEDFLMDMADRRKPRTIEFYRDMVGNVIRWSQARGITLDEFSWRHLKSYLTERAGDYSHEPTRRWNHAGITAARKVSDATRRHEAVAMKRFFAYLSEQGIVKPNPLAEYVCPRAQRPNIRKPTERDLEKLIKSIDDRWDPKKNPRIAAVNPRSRRLFKLRDKAIIGGLIVTGCRITELLSLRMEDICFERRQVTFRFTKNGKARTIPADPEWLESVSSWISVRPKVETDLLFVSRTGGQIDICCFAKSFRGYLAFAGLPVFTRHAVRHYVVNKVAKKSVMAAKALAGHSQLSTTQRYTEDEYDHLAETMEAVRPLGSIILKKNGGGQMF